MTNLSFFQLDSFFRKDDFPSIENHVDGIRYLKLRGMSRKEIMAEFLKEHEIDISKLKPKEYFQYSFECHHITIENIDNFIEKKYRIERDNRLIQEDYLVDQLSRLQHFDWGGSFGNSLEKNIVDNYVKKIQSFEVISKKIETELFSSLQGYTLNSWYNHWTSILIEDIFKDHNNVLPTIGLIKKIDFFINGIPFDLKVTYFPEQFFVEKLKQKGFGNELTRLKQICRNLKILIPDDMPDKHLKLHLYTKVSECHNNEAKELINELNGLKRQIICEAEQNPDELKVWLYENQGEARFDASNRFFLILTDETNINNSWKLKRNIKFLKERIHSHLDSITLDLDKLNTKFYWKKTQEHFNCKSDILFIKQV